MTREENGLGSRLSSSATTIRSTNYSVPRSYGPSLSSYRYNGSTTSTPYYGSSTRSSGTSDRSNDSSSSGYQSSGSALTRSTSSSYARNLYQSPANARSSGQNASSYAYSSSYHGNANSTPSSSSTPSYRDRSQTSGSSSTTSTMNNNTSSGLSNGYKSYNVTPYTSVRSRSSSVASYRSINVTQLNNQAKERAERDEKHKEYMEWLEKEKFREQEAPFEPVTKDFRKKPTQLTPNYQSQYSRSLAYRTDSLPMTSPSPSSSLSVSPQPTRKGYHQLVADDDKRDHTLHVSVNSGFTGLRNIGNTCFMNASLQILVNIIELKVYFNENHYRIDINNDNPLGFRGRLANAFSDFMKSMWSGQHRAIEPVRIKELVAEKASQFANFAQHDAHEFLSFLLDGLHEDLNRVKNKPMTGTVEHDGRSDIEVSTEAWGNYILRNDSIFVDLFHGQYKSRLQCPKCDRISITFDPFVYLPVPFPKPKKNKDIIFWPLKAEAKPYKVPVSYNPEGTIIELLTSLSDMVNVSTKCLRLVEVFSHRIQKIFKHDDRTSDICSGDVLYAFQLDDGGVDKQEIVNMFLVQRQLYNPTLRYACHECGNSTGKLKACEACYNAYYCNKECQTQNWHNGHRDECRRRSTVEGVGQPFMLSIPKCHLTYSYLTKCIDLRSRMSVDVKNMQITLDSDSNELSVNDVSLEKKKSPSPSRRLKAEQGKFIIRAIKDVTVILGETIEMDKTGQPPPIQTDSWLSVYWANFKMGKPYMDVTTRKNLIMAEEMKAKNSDKPTDGNPTLEQMLDIFSETERLKPEESWYCNQCKDHVEATKKLELYRLPPILIVQLKRFVYTATCTTTMHRRSKDERRITYPLHHLDMKPYLADTAPVEQNTEYELMGVICHSGSSYFGHYISMARLASFDASKTESGWRVFDDSIVSNQPIEKVQTDDAYLLFYKQRGQATKHIFRKHYSCDPTEDLSPPV